MIDIDELRSVLDYGINGEYHIEEYPEAEMTVVKIHDGQIEMDTLLEINNIGCPSITIESESQTGVLAVVIYDL